MRIIRFVCLLLCAALLISPVLQAKAYGTDPSVYAGCHSVDAAMQLDGSGKILETSKTVILYERTTDTFLYAYRPDERIYPASMVKIMTAIVALENGALTDTVTVSRKTLDSVAIGSVSANLKAGEELTLKDLLYCMMVGSANDASAVIADFISGSQERFVQLMNAKASQIGCLGTHFSNVHGLHDEDTYTTGRDILRMIQYGLEDPVFQEMFASAEYTVPATNKSEERVIHSTNHMITKATMSKYYDSRVTGGKTGATNQAGRCLAVTANIGDMELVAIVMGAEPTYEIDGIALQTHGSFEEMKILLDHAQKNFVCKQLLFEEQVIAQYPVEGGNNVVTRPAAPVRCVLPKDIQPEDLQWNYPNQVPGLSVPIVKNQVIGNIEVWYNGMCLAQTQLLAINAVGPHQIYQEPSKDPQELQEQAHGEVLALVIGVLFGVAVLAIAGLFIYRALHMAVMKARIRRRRKNRRRNRHASME